MDFSEYRKNGNPLGQAELTEKVWDRIVLDHTTPDFNAKVFLAPFKNLVVEAVSLTLELGKK